MNKINRILSCWVLVNTNVMIRDNRFYNKRKLNYKQNKKQQGKFINMYLYEMTHSHIVRNQNPA